jgi:hypothetical protein
MKNLATIIAVTMANVASITATPTPASSFSNSGSRVLAARQGTSTCEPSSSLVLTALQNWNNDVNTVNYFVDSASGLSGNALQSAATTALFAASNEPIDLSILNCIAIVASNEASQIMDLMTVFGRVITGLQTIITDPNNADSVNSALESINLTRCCNVLPDLSVLWPDAANQEGISDQVNTAVPIPAVCSTITC